MMRGGSDVEANGFFAIGYSESNGSIRVDVATL
jgi:hypothetical protein